MCRLADAPAGSGAYSPAVEWTSGAGEHVVPLPRRVEGMQRIVLLLSTMAAAMLLVGGVALADHLATTVQCPTDPDGYCYGPEESAHIYGTEGPDTISGGSGDDQIDALGGDDYVHAGIGNDTIYGGDGGDRLDGADDNNKIFGGAGQDELDGYEGADYLHGGTEKDDLDGWSGKDQIRAGSGPDAIYTGRYTAGGASSNGDRVVDTVDCGSGYDVVLYEKGIDKINTNCEKKNPY